MGHPGATAATGLRRRTGPPSGLVPAESDSCAIEVLDSARAHSLTLAGRHRFTRYMLTFELNDAAEAVTHLRTQTCAEAASQSDLLLRLVLAVPWLGRVAGSGELCIRLVGVGGLAHRLAGLHGSAERTA